MLDIKKLLTRAIPHKHTFTASSDGNGYFQIPQTLNDIIPLWAETSSHTSITEHPYFLTNAPSNTYRHSLRFKQWDEQVLYKSASNKSITIWYIMGGGTP